ARPFTRRWRGPITDVKNVVRPENPPAAHQAAKAQATDSTVGAAAGAAAAGGTRAAAWGGRGTAGRARGQRAGRVPTDRDGLRSGFSAWPQTVGRSAGA